MKTLILGAKGMLGFALVRAFYDLKPTCLDIEELDISDYKTVEKTIAKLKPELVINAAAYTAVDDCETSIEKAMTVNGYAVGNLAEVCEKNNATLVHFSTDYVFDGKNENGYQESDIPNPINNYGKSKYKGEVLLQERVRKYYLIRTAWLYGNNGKNFVDTMIEQLKRKQVIRVVEDQRGSPTYTGDLADMVRKIVVQGKPFGIYHLTNKGATNWYEFAREIFRQIKANPALEAIKTADFPRAAKRPACSVLINTKTKPLRMWPEALRNYLKKKG